MKNFAKTVSRFLLCERLSDWAKLGLRVFIGFMMLTHGIAKIEQFDTLKSTFPATMGMSSELSLILIILVEVGCSSLVLFGFMTRLAVLPLMFSMIIAAFFTFSPISLSTAELPLLYLGIYTFILLSACFLPAIILLMRKKEKAKKQRPRFRLLNPGNPKQTYVLMPRWYMVHWISPE